MQHTDQKPGGFLERLGLHGHRDSAKNIFLTGAVSPMVLYMLALSVLPIIWGFALAFFEYSARRSGGPILGLGGDNPFVGLQHFQAMFNFAPDAPLEVQQFHIGLKITLLFAFLVLPINFAITLPLAVLIESVNKKVRGIFRTIFFLPVMAPAVGVAIMWGYILHPQRGLFNGVISLVTGKLTAINWTGDPNLVVLGIPVALFAVIMAYVWQDMGYNLVIFIAALQNIPQSLVDAARIDGVNNWQMFSLVTLPLLKPTILLAAVLTMISSFQVFDIIQVMTEGGPQNQTQVLVLNIYNYAFRFQRMGWAAAVSLVLFLLVFSISIVQTRLLRSDWEY